MHQRHSLQQTETQAFWAHRKSLSTAHANSNSKRSKRNQCFAKRTHRFCTCQFLMTFRSFQGVNILSLQQALFLPRRNSADKRCQHTRILHALCNCLLFVFFICLFFSVLEIYTSSTSPRAVATYYYYYGPLLCLDGASNKKLCFPRGKHQNHALC